MRPLAIRERTYGTTSPFLVATLNNLASRADLELGQRAYTMRSRSKERSIAGFETMGGKDSFDFWRPLAGAVDPHATCERFSPAHWRSLRKRRFAMPMSHRCAS
jgi:hypothetical protein